MNKKDMNKFKKVLMEKRDDLQQVVRSKKEYDLQEAEIGDEIDSASQNTEKEMLFELTDSEKQTIEAIEYALKKIDKSRYGKCELCGTEIPVKRIQAIPWVRYCISCQTKSEKA